MMMIMMMIMKIMMNDMDGDTDGIDHTMVFYLEGNSLFWINILITVIMIMSVRYH